MTEPADELIRMIRDLGVHLRPQHAPTRVDPLETLAVAVDETEERDSRGEFVRREDVVARERLLMSFLDGLPLGVLVLNRELEHFYSNTQADLLQIDNASPLYVPDQDEPLAMEDRPIARALRGEQVSPTELEVQNGEERMPILVSASPVYDDEGEIVCGLATYQDITERRILENSARQSQRMESIGRLAGGVAHDFNNLLTAIFSFGQFILETLDAGGTPHADMLEVMKAAQRAEALTRQLLAFSSRQTIQPKVLNLNTSVSDIDKMLRRVIGADVELVTLLDEELGNVQIDAGAFEQLVVNLAVNARDAMPGGGKLSIETRNATMTEAYRTGQEVIPAGDYVMLAVSDNGEGMSPETQKHIFEPFYTTKGPGEGTGLGLATCYGIAKQAKSFIWLYSELGHGTTFKVYMPRVDAPAARVSATPVSADNIDGTETILLVEDDDQVRRLATRVLTGHGYNVLAADAGDDALELAEENRIDLLLTDVVMPRMGGRELADRIGRTYPHVRVLFMSGYTENAISRRREFEEGVAVIAKPFSPVALARKVRASLDAPIAEDARQPQRVLVVCADPRLSISLQSCLSHDIEVGQVQSSAAARSRLQQTSYDLVVCAPGHRAEIVAAHPATRCVLLSDDANAIFSIRDAVIAALPGERSG